jgi:hypothetical protein
MRLFRYTPSYNHHNPNPNPNPRPLFSQNLSTKPLLTLTLTLTLTLDLCFPKMSHLNHCFSQKLSLSLYPQIFAPLRRPRAPGGAALAFRPPGARGDAAGGPAQGAQEASPRRSAGRAQEPSPRRSAGVRAGGRSAPDESILTREEGEVFRVPVSKRCDSSYWTDVHHCSTAVPTSAFRSRPSDLPELVRLR